MADKPNQQVNEVVAVADLRDGDGKIVTGNQVVKVYLYANNKLITQTSGVISLNNTGFGQIAIPTTFDATGLSNTTLTAGFCIGDPIGTNTPDGDVTGGTQTGSLIIPGDDTVAATTVASPTTIGTNTPDGSVTGGTQTGSLVIPGNSNLVKQLQQIIPTLLSQLTL